MAVSAVTLMQFAENLSDRQAADAVRTRIDWTGFSSELIGLETEPRRADHIALLHAALLAGAYNIPLAEMAQSAGLDYQALCMVGIQQLLAGRNP